MARNPDRDTWIYSLNEYELRCLANDFCINLTGLNPVLRDRILRYVRVRYGEVNIPWERRNTFNAFAMHTDVMQDSNPWGLQMPSFSNIQGMPSFNLISALTKGFATTATTTSKVTTIASTGAAETIRNATLLAAFQATSGHHSVHLILISPVIDLS